MRWRSTGHAFVLAALLIPASSSAIGATADAETSVRDVVQRYVDARNENNVEALRQLFTSDADQLVSTGQWRRGLDDLLKGAIASSRKENGRSTVTVESVRLIGSDTAIADGRYETSTTGSSAPRKMWSTFVLRRTADGWRIAAIRNMLPAPAAP